MFSVHWCVQAPFECAVVFAQILQRVHPGLQSEDQERVSGVQASDRLETAAEKWCAYGDDNLAISERHRLVQWVAAEREGARDHALWLSGIQQEDGGAVGAIGHSSADGEVPEDWAETNQEEADTWEETEQKGEKQERYQWCWKWFQSRERIIQWRWKICTIRTDFAEKTISL